MTPSPAQPLMVMLAGPNGAGKSTFFARNLAETRLPYINADDISRDILGDSRPAAATKAARIAESLRQKMVEAGSSFIFDDGFVGSRRSEGRIPSVLERERLFGGRSLYRPGLVRAEPRAGSPARHRRRARCARSED
ncbi:MAG: AAA family ATPase [Opitutales bacterium]|nr:AAA family ATPase [Opitutales bacterium]